MHLEWARHDLAKLSDISIPSWVDGVIYGTVLIVSKTPPTQPKHTRTHTRTHTRITLTLLDCLARSSGASPL